MLQDESGSLLESSVPELSTGASSSQVLETLAAPAEPSPQAAVTGGGAFKQLGFTEKNWPRNNALVSYRRSKCSCKDHLPDDSAEFLRLRPAPKLDRNLRKKD